MSEQSRRLRELAFVRAKNAGPFWTTFDVFFGAADDFDRVVAARTLTPETVAATYQVTAQDVHVFELPDLNAIKVTIPRPVAQGSFADRDMHSGQQHLPLADLVVAA